MPKTLLWKDEEEDGEREENGDEKLKRLGRLTLSRLLAMEKAWRPIEAKDSDAANAIT